MKTGLYALMGLFEMFWQLDAFVKVVKTWRFFDGFLGLLALQFAGFDAFF